MLVRAWIHERRAEKYDEEAIGDVLVTPGQCFHCLTDLVRLDILVIVPERDDPRIAPLHLAVLVADAQQ